MSDITTEKPQAAPAAGQPPVPDAKGGLFKRLTRRDFFKRVTWFGLGWTGFAATAATSLGAFNRFMFPNVLFEPPQAFTAGFPDTYLVGKVDERYKQKFGVWLMRTERGFYALSTVCTHLGCTPNWLEIEQKFKCPCHGSGFYPTGVNFEGPAPRPLERYRLAWADDGQILVDKTRKFLYEKGEWENPESFLAYTA
jgi:cytochrome b6-f complex iron-sulfur subunit